MKKILVFILVLMLVCVTPLVASAEAYQVGDVYEGEVEEDNSTPETETPTEEEILPPVETPEETPIEDETPEEIPEETPPVEEPPVETPPIEIPPTEETPTFEDEVQTVTDNLVKWLEENSALIGLIITVIGYGIVTIKRLGTVIKSASTMNNNAITIAKNSKNVIDEALTSIQSASGAVTGYDVRIVALLEAFKTTAEDKARLEKELVEIKNYLKTSTDANIEFANELAELLGLANIPNYKKEEIGARHLTAVKAIMEAEAKAEVAMTETVEVTNDDREEA